MANGSPVIDGGAQWPELDYVSWQETCATLHMWTQIVGKIRMVLSPWTNHCWHVPLYLTARGLTTSPIPGAGRAFQIDFDFIDHVLSIATSDGRTVQIPLRPRSVADFYRDVFAHLAQLGIDVRIHATPNEVIDAIPFDQDHQHQSYDAHCVNRYWHALLQADRVFKQFRAGFIGKCSPVHFFWGSFDLAVTRFSGRTAPPHPGGIPNCPDWVMREAYSHEVSSCGFWPGGKGFPFPLFFSYAYPEPPGFSSAAMAAPGARYDPGFREFVLPYAEVRNSAAPDATLLEFMQDTYQAAAECAAWDRAALEMRTPMPWLK